MNPRWLAVGAVAFVGCGDEPIPHNEPPQAQIISHYRGEFVPDAFVTSLEAKVIDADNEPHELVADWYVNGELVCGAVYGDASDVVRCDHAFAPGIATVRVDASDPRGETASDELDVDVYETEAPTAEILSPASWQALYVDTPIAFEGNVGDGEDSARVLTVNWSSDTEGEIEVGAEPDFTGRVYGEALLPEGEHLVTLSAVDTTGKIGTSTVSIVVGAPNQPPTCEILQPVEEPVVGIGDFILFEVLAGDPDVGPELLTVTWLSSLDGQFGQSAPDAKGLSSINYALGPGAHAITAQVMDEKGLTCDATINARVNEYPLVNIAQPIEGAIYVTGVSIPIQATVYDYEDPLDELVLEWGSSRDGFLNNDPATEAGVATFETDSLSAGTHTITLRATDLDGYYTEDTVTFTIYAP